MKINKISPSLRARFVFKWNFDLPSCESLPPPREAEVKEGIKWLHHHRGQYLSKININSHFSPEESFRDVHFLIERSRVVGSPLVLGGRAGACFIEGSYFHTNLYNIDTKNARLVSAVKTNLFFSIFSALTLTVETATCSFHCHIINLNNQIIKHIFRVTKKDQFYFDSPFFERKTLFFK